MVFPADKRGLNPKEITIAEILKKAGYATGCFGKWHLGDQPAFMPLAQGFDEYEGIPYSNDMWVRGNPKRKYPPSLPWIKGNKAVAHIPDPESQALDHRCHNGCRRSLHQPKQGQALLLLRSYLPFTPPTWSPLRDWPKPKATP